MSRDTKNMLIVLLVLVCMFLLSTWYMRAHWSAAVAPSLSLNQGRAFESQDVLPLDADAGVAPDLKRPH